MPICHDPFPGKDDELLKYFDRNNILVIKKLEMKIFKSQNFDVINTTAQNSLNQQFE